MAASPRQRIAARLWRRHHRAAFDGLKTLLLHRLQDAQQIKKHTTTLLMSQSRKAMDIANADMSKTKNTTNMSTNVIESEGPKQSPRASC
mmetsp:Transcript_119570/g.235061  ORF Transcript_119570/g.235061 Transcript_119570/m.235061 type:complete len:90 (+) Transcript_119570:62-331(+)